MIIIVLIVQNSIFRKYKVYGKFRNVSGDLELIFSVMLSSCSRISL